ncbi:MAG: hypothetical protein LBV49_07985 [Azonexus sp.]|jgi:hypothetical protein|nr:hypothetical protein [Azonexus sp.]
MTVLLSVSYVTLRKNSTLIRPNYPAIEIAVNPAGTCALAEYHFRGGERWNWIDPYRWFLLAPGNAFYTVTDIRTGKIVKDSTTQVIFSIEANSQASVAMGKDIFYWSKDGKKVNFPGGMSNGYFYEWTDIDECQGTKHQSEYAQVTCSIDNKSQLCENLRSKI